MLQLFNEKMRLKHLCNTYGNRKMVIHVTYLSTKMSMMKDDGFPTTIGSFSVDAHNEEIVHPAPASPINNLYGAGDLWP